MAKACHGNANSPVPHPGCPAPLVLDSQKSEPGQGPVLRHVSSFRGQGCSLPAPLQGETIPRPAGAPRTPFLPPIPAVGSQEKAGELWERTCPLSTSPEPGTAPGCVSRKAEVRRPAWDQPHEPLQLLGYVSKPLRCWQGWGSLSGLSRRGLGCTWGCRAHLAACR